MEQKSPILRQLEKISASPTYEGLAAFKSPRQWKSCSDVERRLLAELLCRQGLQSLEANPEEALESLSIAQLVHSKDLEMLNQQIGALSSLREHSFDHRKCLAKAFYYLGLLTGQESCLSDALSQFLQCQKMADNSKRGGLYWDIGLCWHHQALASEEIFDFNQAFRAFHQAEEAGVEQPDFWGDYGQLCETIYRSSHELSYLLHGLQCYEKGVSKEPDHCLCWEGVATCASVLYLDCGRSAYFDQAIDAYRRIQGVKTLEPIQAFVWAQLLLNEGKARENRTLINDAQEKFRALYASGVRTPELYRFLADVDLYVGVEEDALEPFHLSQKWIKEGLEAFPNDQELLALYAESYCELGNYFTEVSYYEEALKMYLKALHSFPRSISCYLGAGRCYLTLAQEKENLRFYQQAVEAYQAAALLCDCHKPEIYHFWGVALMKLADFTNSVEAIRDAVSKFEFAIETQVQIGDDIDIEWLYHYGTALDYLGDLDDDPQYYEKAVQILTQVLTVDPDFPYARYTIALALSHLGELTGDVSCLEKASEIFEGIVRKDSEDELAWNEWGVSLIHLSQLIKDPVNTGRVELMMKQAEENLTRAVSLGNAFAFYNLAALYSLTDQPAMSIHFLERAFAAEALPTIDEILHDEWLEGVRDSESFREFVHRLSGNTDGN